MDTQLNLPPSQVNMPVPWWTKEYHTAIGYGLFALTLFLRAAVVSSGWEMFVVPLGAPAISLLGAFGIFLLVKALTFVPASVTKAVLSKDPYVRNGSLFVAPYALLILWGMMLVAGHFS